MLVKGKIKRRPGRPWGSTSKKKFGSGRGKAVKSWTLNNKVAARGRPPGRPWHSNSATKVCLLCLQQYNQNVINSESSSSEDDEEENNIASAKDPLADDVVSEAVGRMMGLGSSNVEKVVETKREKIPKKKKVSLYLKFLTILSRHLQVKVKRFKSSALRNELPAPFCEKCKNIVKNLCRVYEEWHNAKLGLEWRLRQVNDLIKSSKTSVSGKLHCTLLKSLSTQLRVVSSQVVDVFRKQLSVRCSAKLAYQAPRVSISKNSVVNAVKANWKWKYAFDQMKQYLQSLIVVFALAVPPKDLPERKPLPIAGPKSKTKKVSFSDVVNSKIVKREGGIAMKENSRPIVKREPGQEGEDNGGGDDHTGDDDHFGGGDYSPPGSGPASPIGGDNEEEGEENDENKNADDSDWSGGAASGNDSAGSDVEFSVNTQTVRRWNLRRRKTRSKSSEGNEEDNDSDADADFVPGNLPPLRKRRERVEEAEKKFSCNLCSQKFAMERGLRRHLSQAHAFLMIYNCPKCPNLRFRKAKDLDAHRKKVHRAVLKPGEQLPYMGRPTACTVCQLVLPSKLKMLQHRRAVHKLNTEVFTCETCGKKIQGKIRFEYHVKSHERPDKPFRCTKCSRGFGTEDGLKAHTKLHDENPDWVPFTRLKKTKKDKPLKEGIFKCDIPGCDKSFGKISNLTIHKSLHTDEFKCSLCEFKSKLTRDFRKHLLSKHETDEKKFFCLYCDKAYTNEQAHDLHTKVAHPTKSMLQCDNETCEEEFENTEQLRQHLKTMHLPPDVEESKENFKFYDVYRKDGPVPSDASATVESEGTTQNESQPTEGNDPNKTDNSSMFEDLLLINPDSSKTRKNKATDEIVPEPARLYTCARCGWSFCRKIIYSLHLILHTPRDPETRMYSCELCENKFAVVDSLQTHYNRIHGPRIKPYLCLVCGVRFHRRESFIPHMRIHRDKGSSDNFHCETCDKTFADSINLAKHQRIVHQITKIGRERGCDICNETFASKLAMLTHKYDVHGIERPFKCGVEGCDKSFYNRAQLKDHKIAHGEATFQCTLCPKKFKRRHNLADHYLVHKQEKNYFCEYCGRGFVKKSSLGLHLDIHRGIKKYTCSYCNKAFCRKFARDCHLRVHTRERPFKCKFCEKDFAQYSALKTHQKNHEKYNNDKIKRVPFRKSIPVGKPLQTIKTTSGDEADESMKQDSNGGQQVEDPKTDVPSYSGILHEAMKATFDDINMELEMGGLMKDTQTEQQTFNSSGEGTSRGTAVQIIDERNAVTAVEAVEQPVPKEEDSDKESEEEEEPEPPVKKKRGRRPKVYKKSYSCGFCGKIFHREDFYNRHVDKHMAEVEAANVEDASQHSQQSSLMEEHSSLQEVLQDDHSPVRRKSVTSAEPIINSPMNMPQPYQPAPPAPQVMPQPQPPPVQEQPRRRGRPPKNNNNLPGSRLARIVDSVLENAIGRPSSVTQNQHHHHQQQQQQNQYPHQQSPHQVPTTPHGQSPSPHHSMIHSGSERSTPAGSPAPIQNHHQQQQLQQTTTITSAAPQAFSSSSASLLSPFLFTNPYLIPRMTDQQQQQDPIFAGFPNNRQQQQNNFSQHSLQQPPTSVSYPQQQFHQLPLQTPSHGHGSARTMPQDLSKNNNYSIFYTNQR